MSTKLEDILTMAQNLPHLQPATSDTLGGIYADAAEATDTQEVRIGEDGKLYTAPGGGSGTSDHSQLTNRDAAGQHPISAITDLQSELSGKLSLSGNSLAAPMRGDLYMGSFATGQTQHAIHQLADPNPNNSFDAVNMRYLKSHAATADYFGGIKAAARDASTDTQEVKIDTASGKLYTRPGSGASSEVPMIVNVTKTGGVISADKTFDEIRAAYIGGDSTPKRPVFARYNNYEYELIVCNSNAVQFSAPISGSTYSLALRRQSGEWLESLVSIALYDGVTQTTIPIDNLHYPTTAATQRMIDVAIGDTASQLTALDNLIGGDTE